MRRGPEVSGWVGSLFPEPIDQVKVPSDRCICHQDCPQYETCETEALDKSSKVYYLLRCVKGKFPACANCMCMACDRYHECMDGPEMGQPGGTRYRMCNRPISITGCPDYSGTIPWMSEAACKKCDHVCDLRKELLFAPRVRCDLNPVEQAVPAAVSLAPEHHASEPLWCERLGTDSYNHYCQQPQNGRPDVCHCHHYELSKEQPDRCRFAHEMLSDAIHRPDPKAESPVEPAKPAKAKKQPKARSIPLPNEGCDKCLCSTCLNEKACGKCKGLNEICSSRNHPRTVGCPAYSKAEGEGWSCSDCLCPKCANNGESCHTCEGPVYCFNHVGKMGGCPDFRAKDGEEQPTVSVKATTQPKHEQASAPITKNEQEMQFLRSDIVAINRLLAELPADHVIERLGFESRRLEQEQRLDVLTSPVVEPALKPSKAKKAAKEKPTPEPPWSSKPVDTFAGAAFRQPPIAPKQEHEERLAILAPAVNPVDDPAIQEAEQKTSLAVDLKPWKPEGVAKKWNELHCGKHHACRHDCAGLRSGALCPFIISLSFLKSIVREGSLPADVLDDRMKDDAEAKAAKKLAKVTKPEPAPAVKPAKEQKPAKAKKQPIVPKRGDNYCVLRGGDCAVHNGCQNGDVPCTLKDVPHLEEIHLPCEIHALLDLAVEPTKEPIALLLNGKWYSEGKVLWDCSDCLCLDCANEGKSCHDCKGFEHCKKIGGTGGKIGACPDFRTEEGKEQHCLENGCLCFKCQLIGERCEQCVGPIRCDKPRMKCKEYVGAEVEA